MAPLRISASVVLVPGLIVAAAMYDMDRDRRREQRREREAAEFEARLKIAGEIEQKEEEETRKALKSRIAIAQQVDEAKCLEAATALGIDVSNPHWRYVRGHPLLSCRTPITECVRDGNSQKDCEVRFAAFPLEDYIFRDATSGGTSQPKDSSDYDDGSDAGDDDFSYSYDGDSYDPNEFVPYDNGWEIVECPEDVWGDEPCG